MSNDWPDVFFINLAHREDRRASMLQELQKIGYPSHKIHRIDAVRRKNGALGCGLSHIKALETIRDRGLAQAIILEDDFVWRHPRELTQHTLGGALQADEWDVCLLSCNGTVAKASHRNLSRVQDCQTTSGYMVRSDGIQPLLDVFRKTVNLPSNVDTFEASKQPKHHIDQQWKALQGDSRWRATAPLLGKQREGYSDITHTHVDYNV